MPAISGNVGGSSFSGVVVALTGQSVNGPVQASATSDSSGNYTFSGLGAGNYQLTALQTTVSSLLYRYYTGHSVIVGTSDTSGVNFSPTAANATNTPTF